MITGSLVKVAIKLEFLKVLLKSSGEKEGTSSGE